MKANHKMNFKAIVRNQEILLQPGQFIFGRKIAAEETGLTEREIRTVLALLINWQNLTIRTTNRFSIITIINWHIYQSSEDENVQQNDQRSTSNRPRTRTKEYKKYKYGDFPQFISFFKEYPLKRSKSDALKAWVNLNPDNGLYKIIMTALEKQKAYRVQLEKQNPKPFIPEWPHPSTWLNKERWTDEIPEVKSGW